MQGFVVRLQGLPFTATVTSVVQFLEVCTIPQQRTACHTWQQQQRASRLTTLSHSLEVAVAANGQPAQPLKGAARNVRQQLLDELKLTSRLLACRRLRHLTTTDLLCSIRKQWHSQQLQRFRQHCLYSASAMPGMYIECVLTICTPMVLSWHSHCIDYQPKTSVSIHMCTYLYNITGAPVLKGALLFCSDKQTDFGRGKAPF